MKIIHDRVVDTASERKSRNPSRAEGLRAVNFVVRRPQLLFASHARTFQAASKMDQTAA
jgi:hypothetical protein